MKKLLYLICISLLLSSCSFNQREIIDLKILDQFDTQKENEQLGIDLLHYRYPFYLQQEFPDFTQDIFRNITWQYFIQENNKQVIFRLILSNDALEHKNEITQYFEKTVDAQVDRQVNDKALFDQAVKLSVEHLDQLDEHFFDKFWESSSVYLREMTTKENFFQSIQGRESIIEMGGDRTLFFKQYYETLPGTDISGFYLVCYTFENDENLAEQIIYHKEDNFLKIVGYEYKAPN